MMNRTTLVGRLTKDPELRYTANGVAVATFTLAVNRPFSNQQGEREADFINIVVWRKQAENVANFLKKGSLAGVDGRIQTRNYENNEGRRVFVTEVIGESVQFLEPKGSGKSQPQQQGGMNQSQQPSPSQAQGGFQNQNQQSANQAANNNDPFAGNGPIDINDDDLPF